MRLSGRSKEEIFAVLLMTGASFSFSVMGVFAKYALKKVSVWELVFIRGIFTVLIMFVILQLQRSRWNAFAAPANNSKRNKNGNCNSSGSIAKLVLFVFAPLKGNNWPLLIARGVFGSLGLLTYMYAIGHLKLADAVILNKASPVFVVMLAPFLLREKITPPHIVILVAAFFGVFNIIKPELNIQIVPGLIGLSSALFAAFAYICVKKLTVTESPLVIIFYFTLISAIFPIPFIIGNLHIPNTTVLLYLVGVGVSAAAAQIMMTMAYKFAQAGKVTIVSYSNVVFAAILGFLFFNEIQDTRSIIGSIIVMIACLYLPFIGKKKANRQ